MQFSRQSTGGPTAAFKLACAQCSARSTTPDICCEQIETPYFRCLFFHFYHFLVDSVYILWVNSISLSHSKVPSVIWILFAMLSLFFLLPLSKVVSCQGDKSSPFHTFCLLSSLRPGQPGIILSISCQHISFSLSLLIRTLLQARFVPFNCTITFLHWPSGFKPNVCPRTEVLTIHSQDVSPAAVGRGLGQKFPPAQVL